MRRLSGQAARGLVRLVHLLVTVALTLVVVSAVVSGGVAWRLSHGPVDLSWLNRRIEAAVNADDKSAKLAIGQTALAWEGFTQGVDRPLDLRLMDVTITERDGHRQLDIPRAEISISLGALLRGRFEPRAVELDGARLTLRRGTDGTTSVDLGTLTPGPDSAGTEPQAKPTPEPAPVAAALAELVRPPTSDRGQVRGRFSQIRRVRIHDASLVVLDRQLGTTWNAPHADIDLVRRPTGGVDGQAVLTLALGDQTATLTVSAVLTAGAARTHVQARLTPVAPAALARAAPRLAPLAALDAPVSLEATLEFGASLQPESGQLTVHVGSGAALIGGSQVLVQDAVLVAAGTPESVTLSTARVSVRGHAGGPLTELTASGSVRRDEGRIDAAVTLDLDQLAFVDLAHLWPASVASGARPWIVENITTGVARDGHVALTLTATDDLSNIALTAASGTLNGEDLTVYWLRPVPPLEKGVAQLRILDPDTLEIAVTSAHQRCGKAGLTVKAGTMRITGMSKHDQFGAIQADIAGSVADAIALLKEPRLQLLDAHPMEMRDPAGDATAALTLTVPLDRKTQVDDVEIHVVSHMTQVHLGGLVAGRDIDQGTLDLDATTTGLTVKGQAQLAGIASQLDVAMDFRGGPPNQIVLKAGLTARPGAGQLAAAGLDPNDTIFGDVPLRATYRQRRAGDADITVDADFTPSVLAVPFLGWRKPPGTVAKGIATVLLDHDRLRSLDGIAIDGDGISVRASATVSDGRISAVRVDRAVFGRNDLHGSVQIPDGGPIAADLSGNSLDLSTKLSAKPDRKDRSKPDTSRPAWTVNARFDRVLLAGQISASGVTALARSDGQVMRVVHVAGHIHRDQAPASAPFALDVVPVEGVRRVTATAADAGAVLRGLDVVRPIEGGTLHITGRYDDSAPNHPLTGTAEIDNFRVHRAAGFAKLLQAMTLYGLVDALGGPGIGFTHLVAPFELDDDGLTLNNARAFSSSLGLTAKGRVDLAGERIDIEGTIVPAYFFNSMLGNVPLIGKLFSPEKGGGLFAARYALRGPLEDPAVSVNPLSALTPGFLRDVFGLF